MKKTRSWLLNGPQRQFQFDAVGAISTTFSRRTFKWYGNKYMWKCDGIIGDVTKCSTIVHRRLSEAQADEHAIGIGNENVDDYFRSGERSE